MADPKVVTAVGPVFEVTLYTGVSCAAGNLLAHNGTGWVLADPSTPATLSAKAVALYAAGAAGKVLACREVMIEDEDTSAYTQSARQYLGNTAGSISQTCPSTDGDLIQVVGTAVTTNLLHIVIGVPEIKYKYLTRDQLDTSGHPGIGQADSGWAGALCTSTESCYMTPFRVPDNCIALVSAELVWNSINASAADIDVTVVGGYLDASNVQDTGTPITAGDWDQTDADNILLSMDISTVLDAGLFTPGRIFQVFLDPDGCTNDAQVLGMALSYLCVD